MAICQLRFFLKPTGPVMTAIEAAQNSVAFAYSVVQTAKLIGVSRSKIYELFDTGELNYVKIGRRTLIERCEIERLLATHRIGG